MSGFVYGLSSTLKKIYSGKRLVWQIAMCVFTYLIVISGFDWYWFTHTHNPLLQTFLFPAVIFGGIVPIITPLFMFAYGKLRSDTSTLNAGFALVQAGIFAISISSLYKVFTGRIQPEFARGVIGTTDISHMFQFGFLKHGAFWGWPSSHTTVAFAMSTVLISLFPQNKWMRWLAPLYALYVGIGVSINIHWFSEFVAGMILGIVIGTAVGKTFFEHAKR